MGLQSVVLCWLEVASWLEGGGVGAVGGVGGPPPSSLITPFTALLLTGDITVTGVQLDVAPHASLPSLSSSWFLLPRDGTGRVNVLGQASRYMAGRKVSGTDFPV